VKNPGRNLRQTQHLIFGEELYQILRPFITNPHPSPELLSAKADKSILYAEYWFIHNGSLTLLKWHGLKDSFFAPRWKL
jgi:hypothetical protein